MRLMTKTEFLNQPTGVWFTTHAKNAGFSKYKSAIAVKGKTLLNLDDEPVDFFYDELVVCAPDSAFERLVEDYVKSISPSDYYCVWEPVDVVGLYQLLSDNVCNYPTLKGK